MILASRFNPQPTSESRSITGYWSSLSSPSSPSPPPSSSSSWNTGSPLSPSWSPNCGQLANNNGSRTIEALLTAPSPHINQRGQQRQLGRGQISVGNGCQSREVIGTPQLNESRRVVNQNPATMCQATENRFSTGQLQSTIDSLFDSSATQPTPAENRHSFGRNVSNSSTVDAIRRQPDDVTSESSFGSSVTSHRQTGSDRSTISNRFDSRSSRTSVINCEPSDTVESLFNAIPTRDSVNNWNMSSEFHGARETRDAPVEGHFIGTCLRQSSEVACPPNQTLLLSSASPSQPTNQPATNSLFSGNRQTNDSRCSAFTSRQPAENRSSITSLQPSGNISTIENLLLAARASRSQALEHPSIACLSTGTSRSASVTKPPSDTTIDGLFLTAESRPLPMNSHLIGTRTSNLSLQSPSNGTRAYESTSHNVSNVTNKEPTLVIRSQPAEYHRARYKTEGSRGAIKDRTGKSWPLIALENSDKISTNTVRIQCYIGDQYGEPHPVYKVSKVNGRQSIRACVRRSSTGVKYLEFDLSRDTGMSSVVNCIGILKERIYELTNPHLISYRRCNQCRLVFICNLPQYNRRLMTISEPINCQQTLGSPEIHKLSTTKASINGGKEIFIVGKNFHRDSTVLLDSSVLNIRKNIQPIRDYINHNHLIFRLPDFRQHLNVSPSLAVGEKYEFRLSVACGKKVSQPVKFVLINK